MMPMSVLRGVARQPRVGVERDAVADRREQIAGSPTCVVKLVSVAPRSSRLNSSILPRFRSHPIHACSLAFQCRSPMEQEEAIAVSGAVLPIQIFDSGARGREDRVDPPAAAATTASAKSLRMAKWMRGSRLPSASTSRCSSSASTPATLVSSVGTITIVRASSGTPVSERSSRERRCGGMAQAMTRCDQCDRHIARRDRQQQDRRELKELGPVLRPDVRKPSGEHRGRQQGDGPQVRRPLRATPPCAGRLPDAGSIGEIGFEIAAAPADQVVADVRGTIR